MFHGAIQCRRACDDDDEMVKGLSLVQTVGGFDATQSNPCKKTPS